MSEKPLVYVYCISAREVAKALLGLRGIEAGTPVYAIGGGAHVAVASDVPASEYALEPLREHVSDLAWAGEKGLEHERVVETCFLAAPTIPLRFCTIFEVRLRVESLLSRHGERLARISADLAGKAEWGLRASVDRPAFDAWFGAEAARAAGDVRAKGGGAGRAYLEQKKAAQDARRASGEALQRALADVYDALAAAAKGALRQPVPEGGDVALKAALLVPLDARAAFDAAAQAEKERRAAQGIRLRLSGPWPPYAFVPPLEEAPHEPRG